MQICKIPWLTTAIGGSPANHFRSFLRTRNDRRWTEHSLLPSLPKRLRIYNLSKQLIICSFPRLKTIIHHSIHWSLSYPIQLHTDARNCLLVFSACFYTYPLSLALYCSQIIFQIPPTPITFQVLISYPLWGIIGKVVLMAHFISYAK